MTVIVKVEDVPGISAATASALKALGLHFGSDLLRTNRRALAAALTGVTEEEIRAWQVWCRFLEVPGITPDLASRLVAAGITSLAELASRKLAQLRTALAGAVPALDDEALVALLLAAQRLELTAVINGTAVDWAGRPLSGAVVTWGGQSVTSDDRGRFRLLWLVPGRGVTLTLAHPAKAERIVKDVMPALSAALVGRKFRLTGQPAAQPQRLSALRGDVLPPLGSAPITTEAQSGAPGADDLLVVADFYANGDARASSLFLDFTGGRFVVRTYRLAKASLPAGTVARDRLKPDAGGFVKVRASARKIGRETRVRAVKAALALLPAGPARVDTAAVQVLNALADPK